MPLALNEIRDRAIAFARKWQDATSERAEAQSFWNAFFHVFGLNRRRVAAIVCSHAPNRPASRLFTKRRRAVIES